VYLDEAADAGQLYAVVDGCAVAGLADLARSLGEGRAACLYLGDAARNYGDKAPYLLHVDRALVKRFIDRVDGDAWGCFVVSGAGFEAVRLHLRGLLTVASPEGEAWLFRFWDPRLLPTFLRASQPDELNAFFGPITAFAAVDPTGDIFAAWRDAPPPGRLAAAWPSVARTWPRSVAPAWPIAWRRRSRNPSRLAATWTATPCWSARRTAGSCRWSPARTARSAR
jgi:hypothetical protein